MGDGGIRVEGNDVIDDASWKTGARKGWGFNPRGLNVMYVKSPSTCGRFVCEFEELQMDFGIPIVL